MSESLLRVHNLRVSADGTPLIKGVSFDMQKGELHVLMGPNGSGKTTLVRALMGDPALTITSGTIEFCGEDITYMLPDMRAKKGLFLGFQNPVEVAGVGMMTLVRNVRAAHGKPLASDRDAANHLASLIEHTGLSAHFLERNINEGFSGGEKKRNELFQLTAFDPLLAVMDETDSGLDVDGTRIAEDSFRNFVNSGKSLLLITHNINSARALNPQHVMVMSNGALAEQGDANLLDIIEHNGFDSL